MQKNIILGMLLLTFASFIQPSALGGSASSSGFSAISTRTPTARTPTAKPKPTNHNDDNFYDPFIASETSPINSKPTTTSISPVIAACSTRTAPTVCNVATQTNFEQEQAEHDARLASITAQMIVLQHEQTTARQDINQTFHNGIWAMLRKQKRDLKDAKTQENARIKQENAHVMQEHNQRALRYCLLYGR